MILWTCTWDKFPIFIRTVKINCYTIFPAALWCLAFVFSSFGVLQLKLYPLWPKVFDATAFSYLTWTLTMCLLNKYNAAGILQLGERWGIKVRLFFSRDRNWDSKVWLMHQEKYSNRKSCSVKFKFEKGFENTSRCMPSSGNSRGINVILVAYKTSESI